MSENQVNSAVGIPTNLIFSTPSSMLNSRKIEQRYLAYGQSSYSTSGQIMRFVIPILKEHI
jgi:hypothetical protein